jgi:hypothetical protein
MEQPRRRPRDKGREDLLSDPGARDLQKDGKRGDLVREPGEQDLVRDRGSQDLVHLEAGLNGRSPNEVTLVRVSGRSGGYATRRRRD